MKVELSKLRVFQSSLSKALVLYFEAVAQNGAYLNFFNFFLILRESKGY